MKPTYTQQKKKEMRQEKQKKRGGEKAIVFNYLFNRVFLPQKMYKMKKEKNTLKNKSGETTGLIT